MPKQKTQIFYIHGGMTFKNKGDYLGYLKNRDITLEKKVTWHNDYLDKKLGNDFQIIRPRMPLGDNAKYDEWVIHFKRYFPMLRHNLILIGVSLGGIFLAKYLSENKFPKKILSTYLVCPPFDNSLTGEDLVGGFKLKSDLSLLEKNSKNLNLLFSKNDNVVPVSHAEKYATRLKNANIVVYKHITGHFKISEFPEIIKMIRNDVKRK
ncbi:alpha/beta hydrolase [Patescibacteria group bacterium]|nr:alpha/beta hydrolase [Patescibacteria group bacterium]MBU1951794.1 alpha/beta hydrolase [Patescibacteria group bacterium]